MGPQLGQTISVPWGLILQQQVQVSVCDNRTPCSIRASPKPEVAFKVPFAWLLPHWPKHTTWPSPDSKDGGINTALDEMSGRVKLQSEKCKEMGELLPPFLLIIFHITNVDVHRGCFSLFLLCTSVWTHWDAQSIFFERDYNLDLPV